MNRMIILILAVLLGCQTGMAGPTCENISLDGVWTLSREGSRKSYPAQVPGTVAGTLDAAGFFGDSLMTGRKYAGIDKSIFDDAWIYRKSFSVKKERGARYTLVFDGIGYYADIRLNGKLLASSDTTFGVFIRRPYDVTSLLKKRNKLEVKVKRAKSGDLNIGFVDWNPRPLDESMGLVRGVSLVKTGDVAIEDVFVVPSLDKETLAQADLEVRVRLRNAGSAPVNVGVNFNIAGAGSVEVPASLAPGEVKTVTVTPAEAPLLHIDNPRIWWSYDLGKPELYRLETSVLSGGAVSDARSTVFGIRSIESRITPEGHRQFTLNGKDILIKGAGWTDDIFLRDNREGILRQVEYVRDMNLNCIRFENIWGKDDTVYNLCDSLGVLSLVGWSCQWEWEDYCGLPETKGLGCINTPETEDLAVKYFRDQVVRLHNHASLIGWLTGSDRIPNERLEKRYMEIYGAEEYRPYVCSASRMTSKYGGPSGTKMEGPYEWVGPDYWFLDTKKGGAYGFNTETGIGTNLPQMESLRRMIPAQGLWPVSKDWDYHCTGSSSSMNNTDVIMATAEGLYGPVKDLEDFVRKAHAVDYAGTRAMFESFRARRPAATGIVQWMLNSAWPSLYWQLYDWYGVPAAAYYGTKKACKPLQLIFDYATRKVCAVNSTASAESLEAIVRVYDAASALLREESRKVKVESGVPVNVFDLKKYDGKPHFVALELKDGSGNRVSDNFYCLGAVDNTYNWKKATWNITPVTAYTDLSFAFPEGEREVAMTVTPVEGGFRVTLENRSGAVVLQNILKAFDKDGNLAVPAFWSDNFFALAPGETKTVTCRGDSIVRIELFK